MPSQIEYTYILHSMYCYITCHMTSGESKKAKKLLQYGKNSFDSAKPLKDLGDP